jgi:thiamine biosynthesis lipoprotein
MRALGTDVTLTGRGAEDVAAEVARLEAILTRFRSSPLTELNDAGRLADPPVELVEALRWALEVAIETDGLISPLVGPLLVWYGYARSWPDVVAPRTGVPPVVASAAEVELLADGVVLPAGAALDLGGTAKSWIVERAATRFRGPFVIDAGGDVWLDRPEPSEIDVDPVAGGAPWHLVVPAGRWGVATSSVLGRAWPGAHHLVDPRTRRPSTGPWVQATVVARSLRRAEVATKLILLDGPLEDRWFEAAWATTADGRVFAHTPGGWIHEPTTDALHDGDGGTSPQALHAAAA